MRLPAAQGVSLLYVMAEEWMWRRDVLHLLGATPKDIGRLDAILSQPVAPDRTHRAVQVAAMGGEIA